MTTPVNDASELHSAWADRFNAKDVDGMLAFAETGSYRSRALSLPATTSVELWSSSWALPAHHHERTQRLRQRRHCLGDRGLVTERHGRRRQ